MFFFSSRRRHTRYIGDWSSDVCSSDLKPAGDAGLSDKLNPGDEAPPGTEGTGEDLCPDCAGSGRRERRSCPTCRGSGRVKIGRASCRERVWGAVVGGALQREREEEMER